VVLGKNKENVPFCTGRKKKKMRYPSLNLDVGGQHGGKKKEEFENPEGRRSVAGGRAAPEKKSEFFG